MRALMLRFMRQGWPELAAPVLPGVLAGGATAICGASAALAIAAVLPRNDALERWSATH